MAKLTCPVCHVVTEFITTDHIRKHGFSTAAEFKSRFGLAHLKSDEMRLKQSNFMQEHNPTRGVGHTPEAIQKMSAARSGKGVGVAGKYERTPEVRSRISEGVTRAWGDGRLRGIGRGCWITSPKSLGEQWVRSSWELRVAKVLDLHPHVLRYEVEPLSIPYLFDGAKRNYWPDFLVVLLGNIHELWEVKPDFKWAWPKIAAKRDALNDYVHRHGWNANWVNATALEGMEMQVGIRPWRGPGKPWVDPNDPDCYPTGQVYQW